MTIVKQMSLFYIQELSEMESFSRFDAIFATFDVQETIGIKRIEQSAFRWRNYAACVSNCNKAFNRSTANLQALSINVTRLK